MSDEPLAGAYAPPTAELSDARIGPPPPADPLRLLGTMFIVRAGFAVLQKIIAMSRGAPASPLVWVFAVVHTLLGVALRRRGATFRWVALAADLAEVAVTLGYASRSLPSSLGGIAFAFIASQAIGAALKIAPTLLLVIGRPGRGRVGAAQIVFGINVALGLMATLAVLVRGAMR